ncbi:MAG: flagellar basal body-associated FliL family protein [Bdellovibrionales bacterium]
MAKEEKDEKPDEAKEEGAAEGEEGQGEGEEGLHPPKKKLSKKMMIIIAAAAFVVLAGGGAGLFFSGILGGSQPAAEGAAHGGEKNAADHAAEKTEGAAAQGEEAGTEKDEKVAPVFFPLGDVLVNLSGDGKRPNFLKIKVNLELADEKDVPAIEALKPRIIDHFQIYLRELRVEDLRGSAGLYRLREELLLRVTEAVKPIRVRDVLFQEMLVQ